MSTKTKAALAVPMVPCTETFSRGKFSVRMGGENECHAVMDYENPHVGKSIMVAYVGVNGRPNLANAVLFAEANQLHDHLTRIVEAASNNDLPAVKRLCKKAQVSLANVNEFKTVIPPPVKPKRRSKKSEQNQALHEER